MYNKNQTNNVTTSFAMTQGLLDKIKGEARKQDRTPSYIIRMIVEDYFKGK